MKRGELSSFFASTPLFLGFLSSANHEELKEPFCWAFSLVSLRLLSRLLRVSVYLLPPRVGGAVHWDFLQTWSSFQASQRPLGSELRDGFFRPLTPTPWWTLHAQNLWDALCLQPFLFTSPNLFSAPCWVRLCCSCLPGSWPSVFLSSIPSFINSGTIVCLSCLYLMYSPFLDSYQKWDLTHCHMYV